MPRKPKNSPKTSINVEAVKKEVQKLKNAHSPVPEKAGFSSGGFGEAAPGSIKRQSPLEQEMGTQKYRQMIHDHNKKNEHILDRLPFTFPKKKTVRSHLDVLLECPDCHAPFVGTEYTVGFVCYSCKNYVSPRNLEAESRGYNPDLCVGLESTAVERLQKKQELARKRR